VSEGHDTRTAMDRMRNVQVNGPSPPSPNSMALIRRRSNQEWTDTVNAGLLGVGVGGNKKTPLAGSR
jgi:hypothetical protein